ncbi:hypothetical protein [Asanoa ferruginea]|uniref:Tc toxin subunit A-related protein n=1 Tax=Asanoa ferruginea TaxID=53367 RepID=UPI000E2729D5|nr:hypothetical protein [Asanoa ferruginea]
MPDLDDLDTDALLKLRLKAREPDLAQRQVDVDIATEDLDDADGYKISSYESAELGMLGTAQVLQDTAAALSTLSAVVGFVPQIEASAKPWGIGAGVSFGGIHLKQVLDAGAAAARGIAGRLGFEASQSAKIGGYQRREQDWVHQRNVVASEIGQIYRQWRAAQIREALAEREWHNHQQLIRNAEEVEQFLTNPKTGKTTNADLYAWLRREVRGLYGQCFQLAYDIAKQAERALQHELGDPTRTFLSYGYQAGREGLLAGERLYLDVRRMEQAYHDLNRREYELTTHVSLRQLDPVALLRLRATGSCEFTVSEELLDLVGAPGTYFRRLRSVGLSIPCVVGPFTGVNATLTLQSSSVRTTPALREGAYARAADGDDRFSDYFGGVESIVASSGRDDSGLFEVNYRDERYLPFEGSGAISTWRVALPTALPQFDHDTIADVVLHLRYTARGGGEPLRAAAQAELTGRVTEAATAGSARLLSLRHDFPTEWARFTAADDPEPPLTVTLRAEHYPYWAGAVAPLALHRVDLFAQPGPDTPPTVTVSSAPPDEAGRTTHPLATDPGFGGLRIGQLADAEPPPAVGTFTLYFDDNSMQDVWLLLTWGGEPA